MKNAQEWHKEATLNYILNPEANLPEKEEIDWIKKVQLDAWKQGMNHAAGLILSKDTMTRATMNKLIRVRAELGEGF